MSRSHKSFNLPTVRMIDANSSKSKEILEAIKNNDGYCPCKILKNEDTKCMCKEFREQVQTGPCQCGLYEKFYDTH